MISFAFVGLKGKGWCATTDNSMTVDPSRPPHPLKLKILSPSVLICPSTPSLTRIPQSLLARPRPIMPFHAPSPASEPKAREECDQKKREEDF